MIKFYSFFTLYFFVRFYYTVIRKQPMRTFIFFIKYAPDDLRKGFMEKLFFKNNDVFKIFNDYLEEQKL